MPALEYEATIGESSLTEETLAAVVTNCDSEGRVVSQTRVTIVRANGNVVHERTGDIGTAPQEVLDAATALQAALNAYLVSLITDKKHAP